MRRDIVKEAKYYQKLDHHVVRCLLCPHLCMLKDGQLGICRTRENREGVLYTLNSEIITAINMDPIEKKPLYHYKPGSLILSIGSLAAISIVVFAKITRYLSATTLIRCM